MLKFPIYAQVSISVDDRRIMEMMIPCTGDICLEDIKLILNRDESNPRSGSRKHDGIAFEQAAAFPFE